MARLARLLVVLAAPVAAAKLDPSADPKAVVVSGSARFTVLTSKLIRCEFAAGRNFVDDPTYAVLNRRLPVPDFQVKDEETTLTISTGWATVSYSKGKSFSKDSLQATANQGKVAWSFGQASAGNLGGTVRTLDGGLETIDLNCSALTDPKDMRLNATEQHCALGLLSTEGWAVVDDTAMPVWPEDAPAENPGAHEADRADVYLFLHGQDFKGALKDFASIAGPQPLPPRYALGTMFTRWYDYDDDLVRTDIGKFEERGLPLDVFIFDMDWHTHGPWGGYSWAKAEFPSPEKLQAWLRKKGLHTGANLHDADGVRKTEDHFAAFAAALGDTSGQDIVFQPTNASYIKAVDDIILSPIERCEKDGREGLSLWWIDYQQGERLNCDSIAKLSPTAVLNRARHTARERRGENERGLILSRWPGVGGHRYAVGFSGDQQHTWKGLQFLPGFTATAANLAFGFWSHDMYGGTTSLDPEPHQQVDWELRTRWIQFGSMAPVMRYHDKGEATGPCVDSPDGCSRISPWDIPAKNFELERAALISRAQLLPYTYTAAWKAVESNEVLVRPMYHEFPEEEGAYGPSARQYFFGPDLVMAPVTSRADNTTGLAAWSVWVPPGTWYDALEGRFVTGPTVLNMNLDVSEQPLLSRGDAVVPRLRFNPNRPLGTASRAYGDLQWEVAAAATSGSGSVYEDDGHTFDYRHGRFLVTELRFKTSTKGGNTMLHLDLSVLADGKGYKGLPATRDHSVRVRLAGAPAPEVAALAAAAGAVVEADVEGLGFTVHFKAVPTKPGTSRSLSLKVSSNALKGCADGFAGALRRAQLAKAELDEANIDYSMGSRGDLQEAAAAHAQLRYAESKEWPDILANFWKVLVAAPDQLKAMKIDAPQEHRRVRALALLAEAVALRPTSCNPSAPAEQVVVV